MDVKLTYYGRVSDKVHIYRSKEMNEMIVRNFAGKDVEITIQRKRKRRSLLQNNYYHGVIVPMVQQGLLDAGYKLGKEQTHDYLKSQFAVAEIVNEQSGEILKVIGSTAEMTTSQMMDYFSEITDWAKEYLNVEIPAPNEQIKIEL